MKISLLCSIGLLLAAPLTAQADKANVQEAMELLQKSQICAEKGQHEMAAELANMASALLSESSSGSPYVIDVEECEDVVPMTEITPNGMIYLREPGQERIIEMVVTGEGCDSDNQEPGECGEYQIECEVECEEEYECEEPYECEEEYECEESYDCEDEYEFYCDDEDYDVDFAWTEHGPWDQGLGLHEELRALHMELAALRQEVQALRMSIGMAHGGMGMPGMGGMHGMGGMYNMGGMHGQYKKHGKPGMEMYSMTMPHGQFQMPQIRLRAQRMPQGHGEHGNIEYLKGEMPRLRMRLQDARHNQMTPDLMWEENVWDQLEGMELDLELDSLLEGHGDGVQRHMKVIINGEVFEGEEAERMLEEMGMDSFGGGMMKVATPQVRRSVHHDQEEL